MALEVVGIERLLDPGQVELLEGAAGPRGFLAIPLLVGIDHEREIVAQVKAGATTYEIELGITEPMFASAAPEVDDGTGMGVSTRSPVALTTDQQLLVLALAEHALRRTGSGPSSLPTSSEAARRLGWPDRRFNKKLDQVCQKLAKAGVQNAKIHGMWENAPTQATDLTAVYWDE